MGLPDLAPNGREAMEARRNWGLAGVVCTGVGVAAGELIAAVVSPSASPVSAVGQGVIGALPGGTKEWAIHLFGTSDKTVFLATMVVIMAVLAAVAGLLERTRRGLGLALIAVFGVAGIVAVAARPDISGMAFVAPVVAAGLAMVLLAWVRSRFLAPSLARVLKAEYDARRRARVPGPPPVPAPADTAPEPTDPAAGAGQGTTRRSFLGYMGAGAAVAVLAGGAAVMLRRASVAVAGLRAKVVLPRALRPAPPVPAAAVLDIAGITPLVTDPNNFYRIDTALVVPAVNSDTWKLTVTGLVEHEITMDFAQLLAKPMVESYVTIGCVSNDVGGNLVGNARWLGWPVRELLAEAGVKPGADMVLSRSTDGFTAGTPLAAMTDARNAMIAVGMDGAPLPLVHGYPARLIVPGLYGYVSATKWLAELKVTTFTADQGYWTPLGWSALGPIKTASRIDVPNAGATPAAGRYVAAGVAWSPERGIAAVQVQLDGGPWQGATLAAALNKDTWVQWQAPLDLTAGHHQLKVRAVDGTGAVQTGDIAPPAPNGATGWHTVEFTAR
ncbi:molybdopterin-dependent oxidoreductase [Arthrobacter sp. SDTb3-6]|uniref:molybdopterin-dependent oxidoreductase n=1 Tax=Arthrobacter sp. SDTb3-6 TaxID=2713571 RepID=UPI00210E5DD2|nr:molybdopterin-dependent oxidoreductase [Arthrobacter sp. SDTb3-6]